MRAIAAIGLCLSMLMGCAAERPSSPATYVVRPQDTLYSIAWRHNLDYRELAKWNRIGSDYRLAVGQVLVLRGGGRSTAAREPSSTRDPLPAREPSPARGPPSLRGSPARSARDPTLDLEAAAATATWVWPTDQSSPPRPVPGGGILLFGRLGQDVRAAAAGRVVYTGNGIRGYGNLIIIKHGDTLLSSYAHNSDLLVHEGQEVAQGQAIAHMGTGAHQIAALYFEIRVNGKPVDPLRHLKAAAKQPPGAVR